ncbi:MAG: response regulator transcription factor [Betaproteobacteria bacterium]|nr:response regulator transcription factor [Betaproteobacteria bacterium]
MNPGFAYIVDDDEAIRDALAWLFKSRGVASRNWASGEAFLADYSPALRGCLVLDVRMEGMSGTELFEELLARNCPLPVIFLTGHGDIPLAVEALKRGAFDFVEKPFNDNELVDRVLTAIQADATREAQREGAAELAARAAQLTSREREVMDLIVAGLYNKVIADRLGIAVRTVEVHRARVFDKMGVRSAVELVQLLGAGEAMRGRSKEGS